MGQTADRRAFTVPPVAVTPPSAAVPAVTETFVAAVVAPLTVTALSPAENAAVMAEAEDGAPWHDPSLDMAERMTLAEGKPLPRKLYAAMAQQECGQCGYVCET